MTPFLFARLSVALSGTPDILDGFLGGLDAHDAVWDFQPDPERFTLREIVAHLNDFEPVWLDRFVRTREVNKTSFVRLDPGQIAIDNDYAHSDPAQSLRLFRTRRKDLVDLLSTFSDDDWQKECILPVGTWPLEFQAAYLAIHDGYHTGQIAQWLALSRQQ